MKKKKKPQIPVGDLLCSCPPARLQGFMANKDRL